MTMKPATEPSTLTSASFEDLVQEMIVRLGEDPQREGLQRTPERVRKSLQTLTRGYTEDPEALLKGALFTVTYDEMVIVKDIEMFSLCEHHLLPFFGKVHVAYIPNGKVIGLSKVPVSYTHLDVYKRQLASSLRGHPRPATVAGILCVTLYVFFLARIRRAHFFWDANILSLFGLPLFSYLLLRSAKAHANGSVPWKGRTYQDEPCLPAEDNAQLKAG